MFYLLLGFQVFSFYSELLTPFLAHQTYEKSHSCQFRVSYLLRAHPDTLLCFFKFVSRANNSKSCPPNNWPRLKYVAIYIFLEQTTLQTCGFWAEEALEAWTWDYFNITVAQKWHSAIFQISAEKSFPACQKGSCTFLSNFGCCDLQKLCGKTSKFIQ